MAEREPEQRHYEVLYAGHVQGVGFRYTVRSIAADFQVVGFVRNMPDGRVQLVVEGERSEARRFLDAVQKEMSYYIREALETHQPATGHFQTFEIRH